MTKETKALIDAARAVFDSGNDAVLQGRLKTLAQTVAAAEAAEPKAAVSQRGKLVCTKCGLVEPWLIENGYTLTHSLKTLSKKEITAEGGGNLDFSESGDGDCALQCPGCFAEYALPKGLEVYWL